MDERPDMSKTPAPGYVQLCLFPDWQWLPPRQPSFAERQGVSVGDSDLVHSREKDEQAQAVGEDQFCLFSLEE